MHCSVILQANKKRGAEKEAEKVTALISLRSPESSKHKWPGQDKHTSEMHSERSRRLHERTLIKMLTETLSIYERGLTLRKKGATFSSSWSNHLSSAFQVHTVSQAHSLHICTQLPTHGPSLITVSLFFSFCFCDFSCFLIILHCFTIFYHIIQLNQFWFEFWLRMKKCTVMYSTF